MAETFAVGDKVWIKGTVHKTADSDGDLIVTSSATRGEDTYWVDANNVTKQRPNGWPEGVEAVRVDRLEHNTSEYDLWMDHNIFHSAINYLDELQNMPNFKVLARKKVNPNVATVQGILDDDDVTDKAARIVEVLAK